jgi:hypothetical protein
MVTKQAKHETFSPRNSKILSKIIDFFRRFDRPISHHEILQHTRTWKWGVTTQQLSNILSKCKHFTCVGTTSSSMRSVGAGGPYQVCIYILSNSEQEPIEVKRCITCDDELLRNQKTRCKTCYLTWRREERAKRGEA